MGLSILISYSYTELKGKVYMCKDSMINTAKNIYTIF